MSITELYDTAIEPLPAAERLRLATLILTRLDADAVPSVQKAEEVALEKPRSVGVDDPLIAALDSFLEQDEREHRETLGFLRTVVDEDRPGQRRIFGQGTNP